MRVKFVIFFTFVLWYASMLFVMAAYSQESVNTFVTPQSTVQTFVSPGSTVTVITTPSPQVTSPPPVSPPVAKPAEPEHYNYAAPPDPVPLPAPKPPQAAPKSAPPVQPRSFFPGFNSNCNCYPPPESYYPAVPSDRVQRSTPNCNGVGC